jgi:hypothetical protein
MASPQEKLERMQEIANRGIQGQLPPEKLEIFNEAISRGLIAMPEPSGFENTAAIAPPIDVSAPVDSFSAQVQAAASEPTKDDLTQAILSRQFYPAEIELWKRDNLSAPARGKMDDRRAINLMRVDLIEELQDPSLAEQVSVGFAQGAREIGQEGLKLGAQTGETVGLVDPETREQLSSDINLQRSEFAESDIAQFPATKGAKFVGEILPTMVIPGGVAGGLLRKTIAGAVGGGVSGALSPTEEADFLADERMSNIALGTVLGGALPGGADLAKKAVIDLPRKFTRKGGRLSVEEPLKELTSKAAQKEKDIAAKEIGVFLSPAERAKTLNLLNSSEKSINLDDTNALNLQITLQERDRTLQTSIKDLIEEVAPKLGEGGAKRAQAIKEGYRAVTQIPLPSSLVQKIRNDDILGESFESMLSGSSRDSKLAQMEIKQLPGGQALIDFAQGKPVSDDQLRQVSLATMDVFNKFVKNEVNTIASANQGNIGRVGKYLNSSLKEVMEFVDEASPEYALARREASLNFARKNLEKAAASIRGAALDKGVSTPSSVQFFQKTLKSDKDFEKLMMELGSNEPAKLKAAQLRLVLSSIENSPLERIFSSKDPATTAAGGAFGKIGAALNFLGTAQRKTFYKGMVDYITDPNLSDSLLDDAAAIAAKRKPSLVELDTMGNQFLKVVSRLKPEEINIMLQDEEQE